MTSTSLFSFDSPNKTTGLAVSGEKTGKCWDDKHGDWMDVGHSALGGPETRGKRGAI